MAQAWDEPSAGEVLCGTAFTLSLIGFGTWLAIALEGTGFNGRGAAMMVWPLTLVLVFVAPLLALAGLAGWSKGRTKGSRLTVLALGLACFVFAVIAVIGIWASPSPGI